MNRDTMISRLVDSGLPENVASGMSDYALGDALATLEDGFNGMSEPVLYTDPNDVIALAEDIVYPRNPYSNYYGGRIPTPYRIQLSDKRWRRVYAMQYGNAGSVYVYIAGDVRFLDIDTEYALSDGVPTDSIGIDTTTKPWNTKSYNRITSSH